MQNNTASSISEMQPGTATTTGRDDSQSFKHYDLQRALGEGGFGQVYQAWDSKLCRLVAIKQLKNLEGPAQTAVLLKEARLAASLQHPAFVKIFAIEDEQDPPSIIMELVPGQTLKQSLQNGPQTTTQALDIVRQVAQAMQVAHASGLIHGDLKPSNLMLEPDDRIRILDFGLASQADAQATTSLNQIDPQGTIAYMAPERMTGTAANAQSDVYALGVILYELLSGSRPFSSLSGLALAAALMQSSSDSWDFSMQIPPAVVSLIRRMTARQPENRYADMQQVLAQLSALNINTITFSETPITPVANAVTPGLLKNLRHSNKRSRILAAVAISLMLAFGIWKAIPYLEFDPSLLKPYSEALTMQQGLEALKLFDRPGSLDKAQQSFETVLKHDSNNAAAVAGMSLVYSFRYASDLKDVLWLRRADASAQRALKLNDQLALSQVAKGLVRLHQGKREEAFAIFTGAMNMDGKNSFAWYGKFEALMGLGKLSEALAFAKNGMNLFPDERVFADAEGTVLYRMGDYAGAEQAFRSSIQLQPDAVNAYANLSATLTRLDQVDEALHVLQQGLQIRSSGRLNTALGVALFQRGDYLAAARAFEQAVAPDKGSPANYMYWGNLADALLWIPGREQDARAAYQKARELLQPRLAGAPDDVTLVYRMATYAARLGDQAEAGRLLAQALKLAPGNANVHFRVGLAYELLGN
ncbi:MAG: protein kinase, partial [Burkholderiales bacterium]|nr:protein kinase [Burkholderiales bacterium]